MFLVNNKLCWHFSVAFILNLFLKHLRFCECKKSRIPIHSHTYNTYTHTQSKSKCQSLQTRLASRPDSLGSSSSPLQHINPFLLDIHILGSRNLFLNLSQFRSKYPQKAIALFREYVIHHKAQLIYSVGPPSMCLALSIFFVVLDFPTETIPSAAHKLD